MPVSRQRKAKLRPGRVLTSFVLISTFLTSTVRAGTLVSGMIQAAGNATRAPSGDSQNSQTNPNNNSSDRTPMILPSGVSSSDVATWVGATNLGIANMEKNDPGFSCPLLPALPANFKDIAATVDTFAKTLRSLDSCFAPEDRPAIADNLAKITAAAQGLQANAKKIYAYHDANSGTTPTTGTPTAAPVPVANPPTVVPPPVLRPNDVRTPNDRTFNGPIAGVPPASGVPTVIPPILAAPPAVLPPSPVGTNPAPVPGAPPTVVPAPGTPVVVTPPVPPSAQSEVITAISAAGSQITDLGGGITTAMKSVKSLIDDKKCLDRGHAQFYGRIASDLGNVMTSAVPLLSAAQSVPHAAEILAGFPAVKAVLAGVGFGTEALGTAVNIAGQVYTADHPFDMGDPDQERALINSLCEYYRLRVRSKEIIALDQSAEAATATGAAPALSRFAGTLSSALDAIKGNTSRSAFMKRTRLLDIKRRVETEAQRKSLMSDWSTLNQDSMSETISQITGELDNAWAVLQTPLNQWIQARKQLVKDKQQLFCDQANGLAGYNSFLAWGLGWKQSDKVHDEWGPIMSISTHPMTADDKGRVCSSLNAGAYSWTEYRAAVISESSVCSMVNSLVANYATTLERGSETQLQCIVGFAKNTGAVQVVPHIAVDVDRMLELESLGFSRIYKVSQDLSCPSN